MSMYVELLSTALNDASDEADDEGLLAAALRCRSDWLEPGRPGVRTARQTLTSVVAYDRSLIRLCAAHDIDVAPACFAHPSAERARLEGELAAAGLHIAAVPCR
jgi:hypothetical protein